MFPADTIRRVGATAAVALTLSSPVPRAQSAGIAEVLRQAQAHVDEYEDHQLSTVIADERYDQQLLDGRARQKQQRSLRSDYMLVQLPPEEDWYGLRDVYDVDGEPVRDHSVRLEKLFEAPFAEATDRAMEISKESARFNLGDVYRTINVPTFALRFLRPASRHRVVFEAAGEEAIGGTATRILAYRETKKPTFVQTPEGRNVPAHGRFWIEPRTGCVVRSELILGGTRQVPTRATVTVTYQYEPSLEFWVPVDMQERYDEPRRSSADVITGRATYSAFRRFDARGLRRPRRPGR